jgi:single-strand DNA-binding protein
MRLSPARGRVNLAAADQVEWRIVEMSTLNKVFLMGRLTRDPEIRYTPQGIPVSDLGLAVNREYTPQQGGERRKETLFIDVTVWRKQAELCCKFLRKGNPIFIEGRLSMDTWQGQDGQKRTRYRVVADNFQFIGGPRGPGEAPPPDAGGASQFSGEDYGANYGANRSAPVNRGGADYPEDSDSSSMPPQEGPGAPRDDDLPF